MCEIFSENGHKVYGFDRKESTIEHPDYKHYCLDIRDKEMYPELPPMQIVINNAGVQNEDDIDINLKEPLRSQNITQYSRRSDL